MIRAMPQSVVSWFPQELVELLGWSLVHFLWQGTVVALMTALLLLVMKRAAPGARYLVAVAGLAIMVACPLLTLTFLSGLMTHEPLVGPPTVERSATISSVASPDIVVTSGSSDRSSTAESRPTLQTAEPALELSAARRRGIRSYLGWFVGIWLLGVVALSVRLCAGWLWVQRLRRRHVRPVAAEWMERLRRISQKLQVSRTVRILESALVEVPAVIGWIRPLILLPASGLTGLSPRQLEAVLAHELAHVRRNDYLVNLIQSAIETLLFYHPAVWWVSRAIRAEREACCDEIAIEVCGGRLEYAKALTFMEEQRGRQLQLAVAANGGPLVDRIRRLLGLSEPGDNRSAWWMLATVASGVLAMFAMSGSGNVRANGSAGHPDVLATENRDEWGPVSGGLRCRLVAVPATADPESPDPKKTVSSFGTGADVSFVVEMNNVGGTPVTLLGVRYGESYPTAAGKLNTEFLAPHLFDFEFTDIAGKPVPRPSRVYLESMLELSGASAHEIAPGKSLVVLLQPAKFSRPMEYKLPPGNYKARVKYHGPSERAVAGMRKHWPDKPHGKAWTGEVSSNQVGFAVAADPTARPGDLRWGEANNGLRAAAEFRPRRNRQPPIDPHGTVPLNTILDVVFHVRNDGDKPISLVSETWRQEDNLIVKDEDGHELKVGGAWYSGWPIRVRWTLRPGEIAELSAANLGIAADEEAIKKFEHPVGKTVITPPGKYSFRYTIRLGSIQTKDEKGKLVIPAINDAQGELVAGETILTVRARTPKDDAEERAGEFVGRVEFVSRDGKTIEKGSFTALGAGRRSDPAAREIHSGPIEIPDCSSRPLTIKVRAPGYEEALFYDVQLKPKETKRFQLAPAAPTRFRLVSSVDGKPVAGAKVRFFNKTSDNAGVGPYPMDGLKGPVYATSGSDGAVVLSTLQRVDPYYAKLGDAVYAFYIEPPDFPGRFLGGVKAGTDLGEIKVGPPLEVRGEIRGTPEELDNFGAEWDQPFDMQTANPAASAPYAVSERLETVREGDKLSFHLMGLRPGKLRIICNTSRRPHSVSHIYSRRDPKGNDVVFEVELKSSLQNLVITPSELKPVEPKGK